MDETAPAGASERQHLGPSVVYPISYIFHSPFFYAGILLLVCPVIFHMFHWDAWFDSLSGETPNVPQPGLNLTNLHLPLISAFAGLVLATVIVANGLFSWALLSYDYTTQPRPLLYITSGMLTRKIDNIDLSIVVDCDIVRHPLDFLFGTGNLSVQLIDGEKYFMRSVENVFQVRDLMLAQRPSASVIRRS